MLQTKAFLTICLLFISTLLFQQVSCKQHIVKRRFTLNKKRIQYNKRDMMPPPNGFSPYGYGPMPATIPAAPPVDANSLQIPSIPDTSNLFSSISSVTSLTQQVPNIASAPQAAGVAAPYYPAYPPSPALFAQPKKDDDDEDNEDDEDDD